MKNYIPNPKTGRKIEDLTNKIYGCFTVLSFSHCIKNKMFWNCKCECNEIHILNSDYLKSNIKCGHDSKILGQIFDDIKVIEYSHSNSKSKFWKCVCKCNNIKIVKTSDLKRGSVRFCSCLNKRKNLIGKKYGQLTILSYSHSNNQYIQYWLCKCECGNIKTIRGSSFETGRVKSCGCTNKINYYKKFDLKTYLIHFIQRSYNNGAKNRNLEFNLTLEEIKELIFNYNCNYCGITRIQNNNINSNFLNFIKKKNIVIENNDFYHLGIDRVGSNLGYSKSNVVSCCKICNIMKWNLTKERFISHINLIYTNMKTNS